MGRTPWFLLKVNVWRLTFFKPTLLQHKPAFDKSSVVKTQREKQDVLKPYRVLVPILQVTRACPDSEGLPRCASCQVATVARAIEPSQPLVVPGPSQDMRAALGNSEFCFPTNPPWDICMFVVSFHNNGCFVTVLK